MNKRYIRKFKESISVVDDWDGEIEKDGKAGNELVNFLGRRSLIKVLRAERDDYVLSIATGHEKSVIVRVLGFEPSDY